MAYYPTDIQSIRLDGGVLCLDFVNTIHDRLEDEERDYLADYEDLLRWGRHSGAIGSQTLEHLQHLAVEKTAMAVTVFEQARLVREALYRLFFNTIQHALVDRADLDVLNDVLGETLAHLELQPSSDSYRWGWGDPSDDLRRVLWPVIRSAADLLTDEVRLSRVKECPRCGWLFLDESKNRSRRWCSMEVCGNRNKVMRHQERQEMDGR